MEARRRATFLLRQRDALNRIAATRQCSNMPVYLHGRAAPVPDFPHDQRRDVFGIGGYDDPTANQISVSDMTTILRGECDTGNRLVPEIYHTLRRRASQLRNGMMYMGPLTAFTDYFPPWATSGAAAVCTDKCSQLSLVGGKKYSYGPKK